MADSQTSLLQNSDQSGQVLIENVLMLIVVLGLWLLLSKTLKGNSFVDRIVSGPWLTTSGMIETGIWGSPEKVKRFHPNNTARNLTPNDKSGP